MKYWLYLVKHTKSQTYVRGSWLELEYEYWFLNEGKRDLDIRIIQKLYGYLMEMKNPKLLCYIYIFFSP